MLRTVSYGGGVQSTALLVLAAQGEIDFKTFLFANVGDNAENPDTLDYVRNFAVPYAQAHGIELHELKREWRDGRDWTLHDELMQSERSIGIPARLEGSGAPGHRNCTTHFKVKVLSKWLKHHGATVANKATVGLGISVDEFHRMRTNSGFDFYDIVYPLFEKRLDRAACQAIIARAGLAVPGKSSCYFCPYHRLSEWREMKRVKPELFDKAVALEKTLSDRGELIGTGKVFMSSAMIPLDKAVGSGVQPPLFDDDTCESGYCMV